MNMKILIVDDESIVLESCRRVLEEYFEVTMARSAGEAMIATTKEEFSLILLDIKMPGEDGMNLLKEMKEKWPGIPVVIMSGYATHETMEEVAKTGAAAFLAKPFTPDELAQAVSQIIMKERSHEYKKSLDHR